MEYKILSIKRGTEWSNSFGTFQSYTLSLEGHGEPVGFNKKVPVAQEPQVGDILYGNIEIKRNKAGNEYASFKAEKRPEGQPSQSTPSTSSWTENPEKQDSIYRSVALNNASVVYQGSGADVIEILTLAESFYDWLKGNEKIDLNELPKDEEDYSE